jgi:hypothetical protein
MGRVARLGICSAVVILCLGPWRIGLAEAEPSDACRDLANRFSEASEELDLNSLASLIICVTAEIQERAPVASNSPQPVPPQEAAPPPPAPAEQVSPPQRQDWGAWPSPAPWAVYPPQSSPWDR